MTWWHYLTLVNIYLVLFYSFYAVMLKQGTFFQLNRLYLIAAVFFSFLIPVMHPEYLQRLLITRQVQYNIYSNPVYIYPFKHVEQSNISIGDVMLVIYLAGVLLIAGKFMWQLFKLKKVMAYVQTSEAYSFFGTIKVGDDLKNDASVNAHESVHVREWHSLDVVLVEVLVIINWFNPVVYLYRVAVKHLHEFIADREVLKSGIDKSDYSLLLVSHTFSAPVHQLVNPFFNKSLLKQRIIMLNRKRSHSSALIKYCLIAPLFILMLIISSATINNNNTFSLVNNKIAERQNHTVSFIVDTSHKSNDKIYTTVEKNPEFPGGLDAFYSFLGSNIKYPAKMRENGVQGKVVIAFVVEKNGALTGVRLVQGVEDDGDDEALRVLRLSPKWKPATQKGRAVRAQYTVPIMFTLEDVTPSESKPKPVVRVN